MTFQVGTIAASITLDGVNDFMRDLDNAKRKAQDADGVLSKIGRGAKDFLLGAGAAAGTAAAAIGGMLTILTKTGVAYNQLQQNSRAALTAIMGSAQAANAQMNKLDDFARNSPFAKDTFIKAQQQLLGFGVEAQKVIPYLDGIQQAVAATGGSNVQLEELVSIMAKVHAAGKITSQDLMEFGNRGVDAATIIGEQMGKTGTQIREEISNGTLDADAALDALATGMSTKFAGATAGIKQQFSGAVDRIKGATRDIGSALAEPFVSKTGGGLAVTWGNQVADVLRAVEKQLKPLMNLLTTKSMPLFDAITAGLDKAAAAVERFSIDDLISGMKTLSGHTPAIAALGGAIAGLAGKVGPLGKVFGMLGLSVNPVAAAFIGLAATSPELRKALGEIVQSAQPLMKAVGQLAAAFSHGLTASIPAVTALMQGLANVIKPLAGFVASIPTPILAAATAFIAFRKVTQGATEPLGKLNDFLKAFLERAQLHAHLGNTSFAMGAFSAATSGATTAFGKFRQSVQGFKDHAAVQARLGGVSQGVGMLSVASMAAGGAVKSLGTALKVAFLSNPIGVALTAVTAVIGLWASANAAAEQKVQEHRQAVDGLKGTLQQANGAITTATREQVEKNLADEGAIELAKKMGVSTRQLTDAAMGNAAAHKAVYSAMDKYREAQTQSIMDENTRAAVYLNSKRDTDNLSDAIKKNSQALKDAQRERREATQAEREAAAAMSESERSNLRLKDAMKVVADTSGDVSERLTAMKQALDELSGKTPTAEEAQRSMAETMLNLKDALAQTNQEGQPLWQSFVDASGKIDLSTRAGLDFSDMLSRTRDKMLDAARAASDEKLAVNDRKGAIEAAIQTSKDYVQQVKDELVAGGMSAEMAEKLAQNYLDIPALVATVVKGENITETGQKVLQLLDDLAKLPAGQTITMETKGNERVMETLRDLGFAVEETPDGKQFTITSTGSEAVQQTIADLALMETPPKVFSVHADDIDAFKKIDGVKTAKIDDKHFAVTGENADAIAKIQKVRRDKDSLTHKTIEIKAGTSQFDTAWRRLTNTVGQAWVNIFGRKANADGGFYMAGGKHFASGGFASGIYAGVYGGIHKMGVDGVPHVFAEREMGVDWETYISSRSSRERNARLLLETARRIGFPVVPLSQLTGRAFADGGTATSTHTTQPTYTGIQPVVNVYGHKGMDVGMLADMVMEKLERRL